MPLSGILYCIYCMFSAELPVTVIIRSNMSLVGFMGDRNVFTCYFLRFSCLVRQA